LKGRKRGRRKSKTRESDEWAMINRWASVVVVTKGQEFCGEME
jgi:hypothetical protein